nr:MAG TPA: hypothetical protein [Caudoviricetes sp.]
MNSSIVRRTPHSTQCMAQNLSIRNALSVITQCKVFEA